MSSSDTIDISTSSAAAYSRYDEYEDSDVDWLGHIPSHWKSAKLKYCLQSLISGSTPASTNDEYWASEDQEGVPWVAVGDMSETSRVNTTEKRVTQEGIEAADLETLPEGTLLYSIYASLGEVSVLDIPATTNQAILGLKPEEETVHRDFLYYWLEHVQKHVEVLSSSNTQNNLSAGRVRNMPVFLPSLQVQRAIATFLDRETGRIDTLIEKKERLIDLLEEKRTALISRVVTKGLDADVEMQDSGMEWLGEIPAGWEAIRCGAIFREIDERDHPDLPLLNVSIHTGVSRRKFSDEHIEQQAEDWASYKRALEGDVVYNKMRFWQGAVGVAPIDGLVSPDYVVARIRTEDLPRYYEYLFDTALFETEVKRFSYGMVEDRYRLYWDRFKQMKALRPPTDKQRAIVEYLDQETNRIDGLISKVEEAIERLKEYRTALISAAVTGQIDVRRKVAV